MQNMRQFETPEEATAPAFLEQMEQVQRAFADLSTNETRESEAYLAHTDSRGRVVPVDPNVDAQMSTHYQQRQRGLQASGNQYTAIWNTPNNFDPAERELSDRYGGQSHRRQFTHVPASMHATAATVPRARAPPTGPALVNQAPASSPARRRADSPSAHGTVRFVGGQREFLPPSTHHAQNGNGAPGPRAMDQAFQEPNPGPFFPPPHQPAATKKSSSVAQLDQSKIDMLIDACGTHRLIILMGHTYQDGPEITRSKVIVRTCAVNSSEPNDGVKNKGLEWLAIFHSIRRDLVARAVEIAYLPEAEQQKQLEITTDKYFEFENLLQWVLEARTAVVKGIHHTPYIQDQWTAAGRKDVLDRVVEKETALASERAMRGLETTVQQTSERIDPQETTGQSFGFSTTINGPARKTVHFEPGVGQLRIGDRENGEFDLVGLGMQQQQAFVELPPGVDAVLAITIDQRLQPSERVKDYLAALEAVSVALFNAQAERESETNIAYELEAQTSDARADYDTDESL